MNTTMDLTSYGLHVPHVLRNPSPAVLYEEAVRYDARAAIVSSGALACTSGAKTGRSPADKRIVEHPESQENIWWGPINIPLDEHTFLINRERAIDYLNTRERLYVIDGFAGWDPKYRIKVRVICERPYHALFMHNMLIRPTREELAQFGEPDYVIFNAGRFPANRYTSHMTSKTSVDLSFERGEMVILGTEYAGEMKKRRLYRDELPDAAARCALDALLGQRRTGRRRDVVFRAVGHGQDHAFGRSQAPPDRRRRALLDGRSVFNIEGGCYAKVINLSPEGEPQIYNAIRFGTVLENVVYDPETREVDYADAPSRRTPAPPTPSSSSTTPGFPAWAATRAISSFWPTMPSVYCRRWPA